MSLQKRNVSSVTAGKIKMSKSETKIIRISLKSKQVTDVFGYWIDKVEEVKINREQQTGTRINYWFEVMCPHGLVRAFKYLSHADAFLSRITE